MIPLYDQNDPDRIFPWVNYALILINFAVFFYELSLQVQGTSVLNTFIYDFGVVPCEYSNQCSAYQGTPSPFYATLFSSMFMHAGWTHILFNMLFLWIFGDNIENSMGHLRYVLFYLVCGLAASVAEIATNVSSQIPGLGASGAIAGILGAYLMLYPGSRVRTLVWIIIPLPLRLPAWLLIGFWFITQLFSELAALSNSAASAAASGVAYSAHVGGFIAGALLIWFFRRPHHVDRMRNYHLGPYA